MGPRPAPELIAPETQRVLLEEAGEAEKVGQD